MVVASMNADSSIRSVAVGELLKKLAAEDISAEESVCFQRCTVDYILWTVMSSFIIAGSFFSHGT